MNVGEKKMQMLNKNVLLKKIEKENKTKSGIILTNTDDRRFCEFEVVSFDKSIETLKEGLKIICDKYKCQKYDDLFICNIDDVVAIL